MVIQNLGSHTPDDSDLLYIHIGIIVTIFTERESVLGSGSFSSRYSRELTIILFVWFGISGRLSGGVPMKNRESASNPKKEDLLSLFL